MIIVSVKSLKKQLLFVLTALLLLSNISIPVFAADTNIAPLGTPSTSFCSSWETIAAINDDIAPANSADRNSGVYGNWDNPGTTQWVQYDFGRNYTISKCDVYWFKDGQGIDLPASCSIQYWNGSAWLNVSNPVGLGVAADKYNTTTFTPALTDKIRLSITAKAVSSTGIIEWKVYGDPGSVTPMSGRIEGYVAPDFTYSAAAASIVKAGFKAEITGTSLSAVTDSSGYFVVNNVSSNSAGYTVKISKPCYLYREIRNVVVNGNNLQLGKSDEPVKLWAGDVPVNGMQDNAINMTDMMNIAQVFNSVSGDNRYSEQMDLNKDNAVNMSDIMIIAVHFNTVTANYPAVTPIVTTLNKAPVVEAGDNKTFTLPANIILSGAAVDDRLPADSALTATWSLQSGAGTVTFANTKALNTTAAVTAAGTYVFKLTVSDGVLLSTDTVTMTVNAANTLAIVTPPSWANTFYKKCIMVYDIPIMSSNNTSDDALIKAYYVVEPMMRKIVADKPDLWKKMMDTKSRVLIVAKNEYNYQLPEWGSGTDKTYRGSAANTWHATVLEDDILFSPDDAWLNNFCVLNHEFAHLLLFNIQYGDTSLYNRITSAYDAAIAANKYNESSYDRKNVQEYFAGQVPRWFNCNAVNLNVPNATGKTDRQQLQEYDPTIYNIIATLFGDYKMPAPWNK